MIAPVVALALEGAVDLRRNRKPHLAAEHHRIFGRQAVQPDNVAAKSSRRQQRRLEYRRRVAVADDGQQILHLPTPPFR